MTNLTNNGENFYEIARLLGVPAEYQQHFSDNCLRIWQSMVDQCSGGGFADCVAARDFDGAYRKADSSNIFLLPAYRIFVDLMHYPAQIVLDRAEQVVKGWNAVKKCLDAQKVMALHHYSPVPHKERPSSLPYVLENGKEFYHAEGIDPNARISVAVCLLPEDISGDDDKDFILYKEDLQNISQTIRQAGYVEFVLLTNYGVELHSEESLSDFGFDNITKICLNE
ncbi:hypothetical protein UFOVP1492_43 [uncultured Caudovirales phage]|uniref:Uncharacterized protein n=1 Tax=uncultured Caudovirales phage TaxID=2100421 RepID=A0A6J7XTI6_9CAUD|nr:hypothetical protein UFOVP1127_91 [uncultured Caudovirales phage]CAB4193638.1 hypothetical protein UFOVP1242_119 [uncultured Caudovirales phage]CAB4217557.1 hypothetical protein UFOVP1492_43 [uncultured Caudovirales phage]CAB5231392.1 hypothetical protein UFOVP1580_72 [uncultured Caudovirales phage]